MIVLKGHLLVEQQLRDIVNQCAAADEIPKLAQMKFWPLTRVARAFVGTEIPDEWWQAIDALNSLRNKMAHRLETPDAIALSDGIVRLIDAPLDSDTLPNLVLDPDSPESRLKGALAGLTGGLMAILSNRSPQAP